MSITNEQIQGAPGVYVAPWDMMTYHGEPGETVWVHALTTRGAAALAVRKADGGLDGKPVLCRVVIPVQPVCWNGPQAPQEEREEWYVVAGRPVVSGGLSQRHATKFCVVVYRRGEGGRS
jgi:hypothetical protein